MRRKELYLPVTRSKIFHDCVTFFLWHISMHGTDGEISFSHFFGQPIDLKKEIIKTVLSVTVQQLEYDESYQNGIADRRFSKYCTH